MNPVHFATPIQLSIVLLVGLVATHPVRSSEVRNITTRDNAELSVNVYPADGQQLLIWQAQESGIQAIDHHLASQLNRSDIEVWMPELAEAYFLPATHSSMDKIPAHAYASLLEVAHLTGKQIIIASSGRTIVPVLRGIRQWQLEQSNTSRLLGLVAISPDLFVETPDPGLSPKLLPIAEATNIQMLILQPDKSPWFWKLDQTLSGLRKGGSEVTVLRLAKLRDRFYFRPDATEVEKSMAEQLPATISQSLRMLTTLPTASRPAVEKIRPDANVREAKKDRELTPYRGDPNAPMLQLPTLDGKTLSLKKLKGKVVVVNFWASWCPPCVHEMPSMERLKQHYTKNPFVILGVNMAEDEATIRDFIANKAKVTFPILLDKDGAALQRWKVFAFPTTYVIDKQGKIRYALFGGVEWDTPEIISKLDRLLKE